MDRRNSIFLSRSKSKEIYGYKDRLEKQFYVTREHGIFSLYYDNAVLNLLKKPRVAGTCTLGETGESPV